MPSDISLQQILNQGRSFNNTMSENIADVLLPHRDSGLITFGLASAIALEWAGYSVYKEGYFDDVMAYFFDLEADPDELKEAVLKYTGRFGKDKLLSALDSYLGLMNKFLEDLVIAEFTNLWEMIDLQKRMMDFVLKAKQLNILPELGAWLTFAPFKIILLAYKQLWSNPEVNQVIMPAGYEVFKAVKMLKNNPEFQQYLQGSQFLLSDNKDILTADFFENFNKTLELHYISQRIADDYRFLVLDVNSGLFELGRGEI